MKPRDLALVGAVLLLGGFAVADALRGSADAPASRERATTRTTNEEDERPGRESFPAVPTGGSLVVLDGDRCRLREMAVGAGLELPLPPIETSCQLWAPIRGQRVAYGIGSRSGEAFPFEFKDLTHPGNELGSSRALFGRVSWSPDGRYASWCDVDGGGFVTELGERPRELAECPLAVFPGGAPLTEAAVPGPVTEAHVGDDLSVGLVRDQRLERWTRDGRQASAPFPGGSTPGPVVWEPANCAALVPVDARLRIVDLGCLPQGFTNVAPDNCLGAGRTVEDDCERFPSPRSFAGTAAAWSPDGEWIAVADAGTIAFHRIVGRYETVEWEADARALAWLG